MNIQENKRRLAIIFLVICIVLLCGVVSFRAYHEFADDEALPIVYELTPAPSFAPVSVTLLKEETPVPAIEELNEETNEEIDPENYIPEEIWPLSTEEIELIAQVTMAEAEAEPEEGQRLVIDTILNRVDSLYFPDTVYDVVWQKYQFSCMWSGRFDRCYVKDELCDLVKEELKSRTNSEVMFFTAGGYIGYGTPLFQVGAHYFSSY